uniref:Uncharacterized protein n=1 Tax=Globodera rostochiensis TaxID=31243 RepID=A0A914H6S4_GLORO
MHPKEAVIVLLLLLVLALCRCGDDWSSAVTRPTMTQTRVGEYIIQGPSNYTYQPYDSTLPSNSFTINNWNPSQTQISNATPSTSSKAKTGNSRGSQTPSATIGGSSNNNGIGLSRFANPNNRLPPNNVSQNANIGSINTGGNSREIQKPSAIIGVISNPNNRLAPNNFSQNPNIGRNNAAGSAFQRYNATSTGETNTSAAGFTLDGTNTSNLTSNNNRPRGSQKPKSAFYSYKKS